MESFTHIDQNNSPCMVDVSSKKETSRMAHAQGEVLLPKVILDKFTGNDIESKKGPVFQTAIIAATMAVKKTSEMIPFCHPLLIENIKIKVRLEKNKAVIDAQVYCFGKTGVEIEALHGVQIAALTIYDMCKALSHKMEIQNLRLIAKKGGKSEYTSL